VRHSSILVVDDDPIQQTLISGVLRSVVDVEIVTVRSGREAVRLLREGPVDVSLILLDVYMPEFDGAEVVRELARLDCTTGLVIMSVNERALPSVQTMAKGFGLNVLGAVSKPIDQNNLAQICAWHQQAVQSVASASIASGLKGRRMAPQRFGRARERRFGSAGDVRAQAS